MPKAVGRRMCGTIICVTPARNAAPVVPAPPWCMTAATRGNSQLCGRSPAGKTHSGKAAPSPSRASPLCRMARCPLRSIACTNLVVMSAALEFGMLPKPMKTGGGPASRKRSNAGGGTQSAGASKEAKPTTWTSFRQSLGLGSRLGLKA